MLPDVRAVSKSFDYTVPHALFDRVGVGSQVRVTLNGRRVGGWVLEDRPPTLPVSELRPIDSVRGWGPPPGVVELSGWAAWRWAGPRSAFLKAASAERVVASLPDRTRTLSGHGARAASSGAVRGEFFETVSEALSGGTAVLRVPPAEDPAALAALVCDLADRAGRSGPSPAGAAGRAGAPADVLVLAPSHRDAEAVAGHLRARGSVVALLPGDWALARRGGCIAVGTRSAAFAPLPAIRCALVLDAHDEAYCEERAPTWCAWEVVAERARRDGAPCVLASACPTLDLLAAGRLVVPSRRAERSGWPTVEIVDRREEDPRTGLFSERLASLVRWGAADPSRTVLCVLNRTGGVRLMACASCSEITRCERCQAAVELLEVEGGEELRCRRCSSRRPVVCARCGGSKMKALRIGVSRARRELQALAGTEVEEVWGDRGDRRDGGRLAGLGVAIGTEALLHRAVRADAVAFLDFDSELLAARMRAYEEALALLARASRLVAASAHLEAAGSRARGRVLVQTRLSGHEVLDAAVAADPGRLSGSESRLREALGLPPFSALALVSGETAEQYARALGEASSGGVEVSAGDGGAWRVRAPDHRVLCDLLSSVARPRGRLRVEVDPVRA